MIGTMMTMILEKRFPKTPRVVWHASRTRSHISIITFLATSPRAPNALSHQESRWVTDLEHMSL